MTSKTTNKSAPEMLSRAVRVVFEHEGDHDSRRATIASIAAKNHKPPITSDASKSSAFWRCPTRCQRRARK
jgi:hypothetical protein